MQVSNIKKIQYSWDFLAFKYRLITGRSGVRVPDGPPSKNRIRQPFVGCLVRFFVALFHVKTRKYMQLFEKMQVKTNIRNSPIVPSEVFYSSAFFIVIFFSESYSTSSTNHWDADILKHCLHPLLFLSH
jgi:hypothetical protein